MKHTIQLLCIAAAILTISASCNKKGLEAEQVPVKDIPYQEFNLTVTEYRTAGNMFTFDKVKPHVWKIQTDGSLVNEEEGLDELVINEGNFTIIETDGVNVNVESSTPSVVSVVYELDTKICLRYITDGEARITVWNGPDKSKGKTFNVTSKQYIDIEYLLYELDGEEYKLPILHEDKGYGACWIVLPSEFDCSVKHYGKITGVHPINTSFTNASAQFYRGEYKDEPKNPFLDEIYSKNLFLHKNNGSYYIDELIACGEQILAFSEGGRTYDGAEFVFRSKINDDKFRATKIYFRK